MRVEREKEKREKARQERDKKIWMVMKEKD